MGGIEVVIGHDSLRKTHTKYKKDRNLQMRIKNLNHNKYNGLDLRVEMDFPL